MAESEKMTFITGISHFSRLGTDSLSACRNLLSGTFETAKTVARIEDFDPRKKISPPKGIRYMSRETMLAVAASMQCVSDSGLSPGRNIRQDELAFFAGTGSSGIDIHEITPMLDGSCREEDGRFCPLEFGRTGLSRLNPLTSFKILPNMPPSVAAIYNEIKGKNLIFNPWESSALHAFEEAVFELCSGREKAVLCGGSDDRTHSDSLITLREYGFMDYSEMVPGEGSSYVMLRSEPGDDHYCSVAAIRSVPVTGADFNYPEDRGAVRKLIRECLEGSGSLPVDLVFDSRDGNARCDRMQVELLHEILPGVRLLSPKLYTGNCFAASGFLHISLACQVFRQVPEIRAILLLFLGPGSEMYSVVLKR